MQQDRIIVKSATDLNGMHDQIENRRKEIIRSLLSKRFPFKKDFSDREGGPGQKENGKYDFNIDVPAWLHDRYFSDFNGFYERVPSALVIRVVLASVSDDIIDIIYQDCQEIINQEAKLKEKIEEEKLAVLIAEKEAKIRQEEEERLADIERNRVVTVEELQVRLEQEKMNNSELEKKQAALEERFNRLVKLLGDDRI